MNRTFRILGLIATVALVLLTVGFLMTSHVRFMAVPSVPVATSSSSTPAAAPSSTPAAAPSSTPAATSSSTPNATSSSTPSASPSTNTTTAPVNQGQWTVSGLGTVAHHNGVIIVPKNGIIIAYGDIHQDGGNWIKMFSTLGPLNMNGLPGDVQLVVITVSGTNPDQIAQALKEAAEQYISQNLPGFRMDP